MTITTEAARPTRARRSVRHDDAMDFAALLSRPLPTSTVSIGEFTFELQALTSKEIDDLITENPPEKGTDLSFHPDMRYKLVSRTVKNLEMSPDQVKQLFEAWSRPDVTKLQGAVFELNWSGAEVDQIPLSETASDETGSTPQS